MIFDKAIYSTKCDRAMVDLDFLKNESPYVVDDLRHLSIEDGGRCWCSWTKDLDLNKLVILHDPIRYNGNSLLCSIEWRNIENSNGWNNKPRHVYGLISKHRTCNRTQFSLDSYKIEYEASYTYRDR
jgi:hypothetical protein